MVQSLIKSITTIEPKSIFEAKHVELTLVLTEDQAKDLEIGMIIEWKVA